MKKLYSSFAILCVAATSLLAQQPEIGTPAYAQWLASQNTQIQRSGGPTVQPLNGSDTLNMVYSNTACGLNYSLTTVRLGQRFVPIGVAQPAPMNVNTMPSCGQVLQAYLYTEALGVASSITAVLTDPSNNTTNVPMTLIGSSVDVCWGMGGTHVWRADVTSLITGSGTYTISGLPTSTTPSGVDVEGATLLIIYADPTASYTGSIQIDDGCHTVTGGTLNHMMNGFNACSNSTAGSAFMLVGDMQMTGYAISMNGSPVTQPQWDWWNEIVAPVTVTSGQSTCQYQLTSGSDCFTLGVAGLYYQTNCNACTPTQVGLTVSASGTNATCGNNGTATATATGGNGNYTYTWIPGNQTTATATGLGAGVYTVMVTDGTTCGTATVSIANTGMVVTASAVGSSCVSSTGSASVSVTGGTGPYTYSWAPSGGNAATASNLAPGNYTCTITDATSCSVTATVNVANAANLNATVWCNPDSCPSPTGSAYAWATGGNAPFTYLWSNGGTTSSLTNLLPGVYCCTITDAAGCTASACDTVISVPGNFWAYTYGWTYILCGDSVQLDAFSSDPTATYVWSPSAGVANPNSASTMAYTAVNTTYYVTVTSQCGTAYDSMMVWIDTTNYYTEQICFVTVDTATNHCLVTWERANSPASGNYNIYRETAVSGVYSLIASQPVSQFTTYLDVTSNPYMQPYRYQITTTDACGYESDTSWNHRSIHLQSSASPFGGWNLFWTAYEGLPIATYNIYRGTTISNMTLLTQVSGSVLTYTDLTAPAGQVWYMIEADHPFGGCTPSRYAQPGNTLENSSMLSNLHLADPLGIDNSSSVQSTLSVAPNPGNGVFSITCNLASVDDVTVTITDALGRQVFVNTQSANGSTFRMDADLSSLAAGVYNIRLTNGSNEGITKLVITQ
jgi:hypothetical protein